MVVRVFSEPRPIWRSLVDMANLEKQFPYASTYPSRLISGETLVTRI